MRELFQGETMPITITHAHAQKVTTPCRIYDTQRGLQLWVKSAKAKYWLVRASLGGKRIELSLGRFPLIFVQEARQKAAEVSAMLAKGIDPLAERRAAKQVPLDEPKVTFAEFASIYIQSQRPSWRNAKHADQWVNRPGFTRHFLAYKFRPSRGCHEWEAIYRGISN